MCPNIRCNRVKSFCVGTKQTHNLDGNVNPPSTTNQQDNLLSKFIILGGVTSPLRLSFFFDEGSAHIHMHRKTQYTYLLTNSVT